MSKQSLDDLNAVCGYAAKRSNDEDGSTASEETTAKPAQTTAITSEAMENLVADIRQRYGLADNSYGNRIIDKIMKRSENSLVTARSVLPQYIEKVGATYPKKFNELIIAKFMDDKETSSGQKLPEDEQRIWREIPQIIAYMEHTTYRPTLN